MPVIVGNRFQVFLKHEEDGPEIEYILPGQINVFVQREYSVHILKFNWKHYEASEFNLEKGYFNEKSFQGQKDCHRDASTGPTIASR